MTGTSLIATMAAKHNMDPGQFARTIRATVMPSEHTEEQFAAFMLTANRYGLDPVTREIYAYPGRGKSGGITPVVSVDGWIHLVNSHPACNGFEFRENRDAGKLVSVTCTLWRKDREHPVVVTEYLAECYRNTDPWNQMPTRMLRHKAFKECARLAFGFAGIADEDEARDMQGAVEKLERPIAAPPARVSDQLDHFAAELDNRATAAPQAAETASDDFTADDMADGERFDIETGEIFDPWQDAVRDILAYASDPDQPQPARLEKLEQLRPAYEDGLPAERFTELFAVARKVAKGEQKLAAARKYLEAM